MPNLVICEGMRSTECPCLIPPACVLESVVSSHAGTTESMSDIFVGALLIAQRGLLANTHLRQAVTLWLRLQPENVIRETSTMGLQIIRSILEAVPNGDHDF